MWYSSARPIHPVARKDRNVSDRWQRHRRPRALLFRDCPRQPPSVINRCVAVRDGDCNNSHRPALLSASSAWHQPLEAGWHRGSLHQRSVLSSLFIPASAALSRFLASVSCVTAAQQWPGQCGTAYKTVREILFLSQILVISTEGHIHRKATPRAFHQHSGLQRGDRQQREAREDAIEFFWTYKHLQTRPAIENDRWTTEDETVPHCPALVRILWLLSSG